MLIKVNTRNNEGALFVVQPIPRVPSTLLSARMGSV